MILYRDGEGVLHCIAFVSWCSNLQHVWLQIVQPDYGMQKQGSVYSNTWAIMDQVHTCIELNWFCMLSTLPCKLGMLIFIALNGTADFEFILLFICNCYCKGILSLVEGLLFDLNPSKSKKWLRCNFSLQYPYYYKQKSDENEEKYQLGDYLLIQNQILRSDITRTVWQIVRRITN